MPRWGQVLRLSRSYISLTALLVFQGLGNAVSVAVADIGVGVGSNPISLGGPAAPGQSYGLAPLRVVNTGTEVASYTITVQRLLPGDETAVPPEWIKLGDNGFLLGPQQAASVPVTLTLPRDASAGVYLTNLVATGRPPAAGGAVLGAAAAAKLTFTVASLPAGEPGPPATAASERSSSGPDWIWGGLAGGALAGAAVVFLRSLGFRVRGRPKA